MKPAGLFLIAVAAATGSAGVDAARADVAPPPSPDGFKAREKPSGPCDNLGLQYAYYADDFDFTDASSFQAYDPARLKRSRRVRQTGVTTLVDYFYRENSTNANQTQPVYPDQGQQRQQRPLPARFFALNHRGYVYAETTGTYSFFTNQADDIAFVWLGRSAYAGWTRGNANSTVQIRSDYAPGYGGFEAQLVAGHYYPLRIVYKQGDGDAQLSVSVLDASYQNLLGFPEAPKPASNAIVQFSCDGISAPPYPLFGFEI